MGEDKAQFRFPCETNQINHNDINKDETNLAHNKNTLLISQKHEVNYSPI